MDFMDTRCLLERFDIVKYPFKEVVASSIALLVIKGDAIRNV